MKKILLAFLPLALLAAGCNECEKGSELKTELVRLETQVTGTMAQPSNFTATCLDVQSFWNKKLVKGASFANYIADTFFTSDECVRSHIERRCHWEWDGADGISRPHRHYECYTYTICDERISRKKDGYEDAKELANLLTGTRGDLLAACAAHDRNADAEAYLHLTGAKIKLSSATSDADVVMQKAGCYGRRGD